MLCSDTSLHQRLSHALPLADIQQMARSVSRLMPAQLIKAISASPDASLPPIIFIPDGDGFMPQLISQLSKLQHPCFMLSYPGQQHLATMKSLSSLAAVLCAAIKTCLPKGPYVLAGIGFGGVVAYEVSLQLQAAGNEVSTLAVDALHQDCCYLEGAGSSMPSSAVGRMLHGDLVFVSGLSLHHISLPLPSW